MKKNIMLMLLVYCTMSISLFAQKSNKELANEYLNLKGEVIFSFTINNKTELSTITKELAIVHFDENTNSVKVMANKSQFSSFLQKNVPFTVTSEDNIIGYKTMTSDLAIKAATFPLTAYPTYADYVTMMNDFATNNPSLCKVENIGATGEGDKSILFVKLSDNVNQNEQEPRVMYTSSMHGDEIAGYPMMLNLIDYLLGAYNNTSHPKHAEIKNLLDNNEVWINPLANPDGTYRNSANNTSVANATRGNANNVDLNRNYPDPDDGAHPDGNSYQTETVAFMNFADTKHFVLSANFHGGIELINYPWDTYAGAHPDEDYFIYVSKEYRDHCQANSPSGYFTGQNNGITNGYAWYEVQGGRQDYQIYNQKGREVTVELSNNKTPAASQLVNYWNYNREALLAFLKQINYGIRGVVTDAATNQPIQAKVTVVGRESYDSWTPTELPEGDYYRPIKAGTYDILYEAECYESLTLTGVTVADYAAVVKNVQLTPIAGVAPTGLAASNIQPTTATLNWNANSGATYDVRYRATGGANWTTLSSNTNTINITGLIASTQYEAQVRSNCAGGASSPYSTLINFTTTDTQACTGINSFPYTESFETGLGLWTNATGDDINWTRDSGGTSSSSTGPSSAQDGTFYLYTEASTNVTPPGSPNKTALLNSPCIDLATLSGISLEFGYHMYGSNMGTMEVLVSTDDGANYTSLWTKSGDLGNSWNQATIDLTAYAGSVIKLQFKGTTGTSFRSDMAIDNISIKSSAPDTEAPSVPTGLSTSSVTSTTIGLSWNASTDNIGVSGYEVYQGATLITTVTSTSYTVTGLTPNTSYTFSVKAKDAAGNTSSSSNTASATTSDVSITYCASKGNNVSYEYIDYVELGGITNATAANAGYGDFTNLVANIGTGTNTIVVSAGFANTAYREYWSIWIDYNQNGTFDAAEQIVSNLSNSSANQSFNFDVPTTAVAGNTRMRVSMKYSTASGPCDTFTYGEVEDYTVNISTTLLSKGNEPSLINNLVLYPNPIKDGVLFLKNINQKNVSFRIVNYMGQTVMQDQLSEDKINVTRLPNGMYFLEVNTGNKTITKKFIITK
ncbi:chitodextrinase [Aquimarina sp. EL_43]|uniref:M14 family zinc carboxypeptidase n=1 Tax=unclassified Aquimarina TaxID=2627091 RepID=UPI0018CAC5F9|nr:MULTISPECIES: M14 family zinc carboxypeptidase [unclassified Aquimarina]MBG6129646.1 chitodextrinase [Aquimarina sp. EL_35]MBG6150711.1 chitodextrinase [Aquimarina sp. EL_32]MBG6167982.1 chitodextrinase [Aquimarina sp. EL_43]